MIKSLAFWDVMSDSLGVERASVDRAARKLREAALIRTGAGRHAPDVTPREAARYLIAFLGSGVATYADKTVARFMPLPVDPKSDGLKSVAKDLALPRKHTLGDAVEALLVRLPRLMEADEDVGDVGTWWLTLDERRGSARLIIGAAKAEYHDPRPFDEMRRAHAQQVEALAKSDDRALANSIEAHHRATTEFFSRKGMRTERTVTQYELLPICEALAR